MSLSAGLTGGGTTAVGEPPVWQTVCVAQITLRGNPINTVGELPAVGSPAPGFSLTGTDLGTVSDEQFRGKPFLLNIFPSVDTPGVCDQRPAPSTSVPPRADSPSLCVSNDLPFALNRFCGAEGIENVVTASSFRDSFGEDYGSRPRRRSDGRSPRAGGRGGRRER